MSSGSFPNKKSPLIARSLATSRSPSRSRSSRTRRFSNDDRKSDDTESMDEKMEKKKEKSAKGKKKSAKLEEKAISASMTKDLLEQKIEDLTRLLTEEKQVSHREKVSVSRLQRELSRQKSDRFSKDGMMKELEQERSLRMDAEDRLREMTSESNTCKTRLHRLQEEFHKMEEIVRSMMQYKTKIDQLKQEKSSLAVTYEKSLQKCRSHIGDLERENIMLLNDVKKLESQVSFLPDDRNTDKSKLLLERLKILEAENSSLVLENEQQREQYERCLDEIANQVVQALLAQKMLREECMKLQGRVQDLELQNQQLNVMFQQRMRFASDSFLQSFGTRRLQMSRGLDSASSRGSSVASLTNQSHRSLPTPSGQKGDGPMSGSFLEESADSIQSICSDNIDDEGPGMPEMSSMPPWLRDKMPPGENVSLLEFSPPVPTIPEDSDAFFIQSSVKYRTKIETEFPATNSSPKIKHIGIFERQENPALVIPNKGSSPSRPKILTSVQLLPSGKAKNNSPSDVVTKAAKRIIPRTELNRTPPLRRTSNERVSPVSKSRDSPRRMLESPNKCSSMNVKSKIPTSTFRQHSADSYFSNGSEMDFVEVDKSQVKVEKLESERLYRTLPCAVEQKDHQNSNTVTRGQYYYDYSDEESDSRPISQDLSMASTMSLNELLENSLDALQTPIEDTFSVDNLPGFRSRSQDSSSTDSGDAYSNNTSLTKNVNGNYFLVQTDSVKNCQGAHAVSTSAPVGRESSMQPKREIPRPTSLSLSQEKEDKTLEELDSFDDKSSIKSSVTPVPNHSDSEHSDMKKEIRTPTGNIVSPSSPSVCSNKSATDSGNKRDLASKIPSVVKRSSQSAVSKIPSLTTPTSPKAIPVRAGISARTSTLVASQNRQKHSLIPRCQRTLGDRKGNIPSSPKTTPVLEKVRKSSLDYNVKAAEKSKSVLKSDSDDSVKISEIEGERKALSSDSSCECVRVERSGSKDDGYSTMSSDAQPDMMEKFSDAALLKNGAISNCPTGSSPFSSPEGSEQSVSKSALNVFDASGSSASSPNSNVSQGVPSPEPPQMQPSPPQTRVKDICDIFEAVAQKLQNSLDNPADSASYSSKSTQADESSEDYSPASEESDSFIFIANPDNCYDTASVDVVRSIGYYDDGHLDDIPEDEENDLTHTCHDVQSCYVNTNGAIGSFRKSQCFQLFNDCSIPRVLRKSASDSNLFFYIDNGDDFSGSMSEPYCKNSRYSRVLDRASSDSDLSLGASRHIMEFPGSLKRSPRQLLIDERTVANRVSDMVRQHFEARNIFPDSSSSDLEDPVTINFVEMWKKQLKADVAIPEWNPKQTYQNCIKRATPAPLMTTHSKTNYDSENWLLQFSKEDIDRHLSSGNSDTVKVDSKNCENGFPCMTWPAGDVSKQKLNNIGRRNSSEIASGEIIPDSKDGDDKMDEALDVEEQKRFRGDFYSLCRVESNKSLFSNCSLESIPKIPMCATEHVCKSGDSKQVENDEFHRISRKISDLSETARELHQSLVSLGSSVDGDLDQICPFNDSSETGKSESADGYHWEEDELYLTPGSEEAILGCNPMSNMETTRYWMMNEYLQDQAMEARIVNSGSAANFESNNETADVEKCKEATSRHATSEADFNDVMYQDKEKRASLLDEMIASPSLDSLCSDVGLDRLICQRLQGGRAMAAHDVIRCGSGSRPAMDFSKFFIRYSQQELDAVSAFDFLDEMSAASSCAEMQASRADDQNVGDRESARSYADRGSVGSDIACVEKNRLKRVDRVMKHVQNQARLHIERAMTRCSVSCNSLDSQDVVSASNMSLSDSCCEGFSSTNVSINDITML